MKITAVSRFSSASSIIKLMSGDSYKGNAYVGCAKGMPESQEALTREVELLLALGIAYRLERQERAVKAAQDAANMKAAQIGLNRYGTSFSGPKDYRVDEIDWDADGVPAGAGVTFSVLAAGMATIAVAIAVVAWVLS